MDGTGNPWFYADIAVKGQEIVAIGHIEGTAKKTIDATNLFVLPGFIDIHSHADDGAFGGRRGLRAENPLYKSAHNLVHQGVTTVVVNHDGRSPNSIALQRKELQEEGVGPNVALMVGHNSIRRLAMSPDYQRESTPAELERMKESLIEGMKAGAFGMSAGLEYVPGRWSNTKEIIELVEVLKPYGGIYMVHERYSGSDPMWYLPSRDGNSPGTILDNVREVIKVAEETGVTSCATHIKVKGADFWGVSTAIVNLIQQARDRGVDIWVDQYPYNTTGTDGNTVLLPDWAIKRNRWDRSDASTMPNYSDSLRSTLSDKASFGPLTADILREIERRGGPEKVVVFEHPDSTIIGLSLVELARKWEVDWVQVAIDLQLKGDPKRPGGGRLRGFSLSEQDIEILMQQPWLITASDAGIGIPGGRSVHPRYYGTFPRKIAWYAKERGIISIAHAVRSMTSLPAQFLGLTDRGTLRVGNKADITLLDMEAIKDNATFFEPHQYPTGIHHVMVNGELLIEDGQLLDILPGEVLSNQSSFRSPKFQNE